MLSREEKERYARHFSLATVGIEGQEKLKNASVLCIGAGGLGSPSILYLAAAGVGKIGIVDPDQVELSNLQRQIIHSQSSIQTSKLESATRRIAEINPHVEVVPHPCAFTADNAIEIASQYDLIIDGTDNFPTRYLSNDVAYFLKKPNIYASIFQFEGQLSVFAPHLGGPCYRCMLPTPPDPGSVPSCAEAGVLGVLPGVIGSMQAMEAIKLILEAGTPPLGRLIHYDALQTRFREFKLKRDPECPLCGEQASITELIDYQEFCGLPEPKTQAMKPSEINVDSLKQKLTAGCDSILIDVRQPWEYDVANIEGFRLVPLATIPSLVPELEVAGRDSEIVLLCKGGVRSARAQQFLVEQGFTNTINVIGGMDAWQRANH